MPGHSGSDGDTDRVAVGVELLAALEFESLSMADAVDRIEAVTTNPRTTRAILDAAEQRGLIERDAGRIYPQGGGHVDFDADVIRKDGAFSCRRCGCSLSTGHFIQFDAGEVGPFGSSCIRIVTGRE
ncbi:DUF5830 family protein [Halobacterium salinarum]|uniref:DUF5830 family protein n=1 Tax=Halobacterium salinarum TaxID=2242 RepID=UPI0025575849|nr:DUF5830 family protein [Halobacterium salinarum]MDL0122312.1 DUF5830 family protein [Halobacterium salinarum]